MDVNSAIMGLKTVTGYPVQQDIYTGADKKYITFTYQDERPHECADNEVLSDLVEVYVHMYLPTNYKYFEDKKKVRTYLEKNGFLVNSIGSGLDTIETKGQLCNVRRITYDCLIVVPREEEE